MGLSFSEDNQSWADLGDLSAVTCITRPRTCERGFTISMMIKTDESCLAVDGLLSTYDVDSQGLVILCRQTPNGVGYENSLKLPNLKFCLKLSFSTFQLIQFGILKSLISFHLLILQGGHL